MRRALTTTVLFLAFAAAAATLGGQPGCNVDRVVEIAREALKPDPERTRQCAEPGRDSTEACEACCKSAGGPGYLVVNGECQCL